MHFVDRSLCSNAPLAILSSYHNSEQPKWLSYKTWVNTKVPPSVPKPSSKWTNDNIRTPLTVLFKNNCAYCGDYSDSERDGEVDHFLPTERDANADHIYSWDNYVWACHSCNNKKSNNHPLINPCDNNDVLHIVFDHTTGKYNVISSAPNDIKDKFALTDQFTFINKKKKPERRKLVYRHINILHLENIRVADDFFEYRKSQDPTSAETQDAEHFLNQQIEEFKVYLATSDFVLLKQKIFDDYRTKHPTFKYTYSDFV